MERTYHHKIIESVKHIEYIRDFHCYRMEVQWKGSGPSQGKSNIITPESTFYPVSLQETMPGQRADLLEGGNGLSKPSDKSEVKIEAEVSKNSGNFSQMSPHFSQFHQEQGSISDGRSCFDLSRALKAESFQEEGHKEPEKRGKMVEDEILQPGIENGENATQVPQESNQ